eukprot:6204344-Prymnesium_polylepis.1
MGTRRRSGEGSHPGDLRRESMTCGFGPAATHRDDRALVVGVVHRIEQLRLVPGTTRTGRGMLGRGFAAVGRVLAHRAPTDVGRVLLLGRDLHREHVAVLEAVASLGRA